MSDDATSALAASERRFRALIEHSGDGIAVIDADNRILYLSPGVTAVEGYTPEELVGRNGLENTHPDDLVLVEKVVAQLVASPGRPVPVLWRRRHKDGRWLWLEGTATNLLHDPEVRGIVTNYRDVTERIASEEALRHSEAHLRTVVDNLGEGVAVSDLDGRLLEFNRAAVEMLGFSSPREYLRRLPEFTDTFELASLDGQVLPLEQWPLSRILRGEDVSDLEVSMRRPKTGWHRIFSYGGALVRNESGKPLLAILTMRDVTERKEAEWRIEAQVEHLSLLDQITRAIGQRQDLRSIFQVVVRSLEEGLPLDLCRILQYDRVAGELRRAPLGSGEPAATEQAPIPVDENGLARCVRGVLVYEPDIGQTGVPFTQAMARAGQRSMVLAPLRTQDEVLGVLVACRREADAFTSVECEFLRQLGEHVGLAAQQSDLHSALQKAYDDLRRTQQAVIQQERLRALGEMASGIAHDINNAISPVSLYTESLLETEPGLSPRARGHLETIQRAVGDVAHTVARMREFYRHREAEFDLSPIEVNRLVAQVLDFTRARWSDMPQQRGVVIQAVTDLGPDLPKVMGIASEIREALTNLVFNAVDAMPAGGTLTLRTRTVAGAAGPTAVAIEVEDQGLGMDEDTRRRCLEPFFTTKGERGTGLGLPMVFGAAQRHGAELRIESTLGAGTTVRIVFPLSSVPGPEVGADDALPRKLARLRLLVIDDDPVLLRALGEALETNGHHVATAGAGQAGIDAFRVAEDRAQPFDAVITDLGMPHVDGRRVAAAVKERAPATPVLLLTGWGQRMAKDGDTPDHVDRVLSKPPKVRDILAALDQVLRPPVAPTNP